MPKGRNRGRLGTPMQCNKIIHLECLPFSPDHAGQIANLAYNSPCHFCIRGLSPACPRLIPCIIYHLMCRVLSP